MPVMDVHEDQVPFARRPGLDRLGAVVDHDGIDAELVQQGLHHQLVHGVVLGDQDAQGRAARRLDDVLRRGKGRGGARPPDPGGLELHDKGRPQAWPALHLDGAFHQVNQFPADREPKPGPPEAPGRRRLGLHELAEQ